MSHKLYGMNQLIPLKDRDEELEELWDELTDVPMNPKTECMEAAFLHFPAGTPREDIWHWFDERHSQGVHYLLYGAELDRDKVNKLLMLADKSRPCMSPCVYNHKGWCRFVLVNEKAPEFDRHGDCIDAITGF